MQERANTTNGEISEISAVDSKRGKNQSAAAHADEANPATMRSPVLSRENATRNPARTAATAAALMIGLGVVVFGGRVRAGLQGLVRDRRRPLGQCRHRGERDGWRHLPHAALATVRGVPGVDKAAGIYTTSTQVNGDSTGREPGVRVPGTGRSGQGSCDLAAASGRSQTLQIAGWDGQGVSVEGDEPQEAIPYFQRA